MCIYKTLTLRQVLCLNCDHICIYVYLLVHEYQFYVDMISLAIHPRGNSLTGGPLFSLGWWQLQRLSTVFY